MKLPLVFLCCVLAAAVRVGAVEQADEKPPHFVDTLDSKQFLDLHLIELIILEAALSFLGAGIPPPNPSWGRRGLRSCAANGLTGTAVRPCPSSIPHTCCATPAVIPAAPKHRCGKTFRKCGAS